MTTSSTLIAVVAIALLGAGCEQSSFRDCAISCNEAGGCPGGLTCEAEGYCRLEGAIGSCAGVRDAALDVDSDPDDPDADPSCSCADSTTLDCPSGQTTCVLGCSSSGDAHCKQVVPSNELALDQIDAVDTAISIAGGIATFDTDTGAITGVITRPAGEGVSSGIGFAVETASSPIGVFTFHALTVVSSGRVRFTGSRAAAFVVGTSAVIDGWIDGSGGCYGGNPSCAGPGGGTGGGAAAATGCGPGGAGASGGTVDSGDAGGGGGGGQAPGAAGGMGGTFAGAPGGFACVPGTGEPLIGGSGGGTGGSGSALNPAHAGGGGGGFQLTALEEITIDGRINMGGGGGAGGPAGVGASNAAGAGGGGAGGAILIEAPVVTISGAVGANGGGGGGGGLGGEVGADGETGAASAVPAAGGTAGGTGTGHGGDGGTASAVNQPGALDASNGGGGGGAVGAIFLRTASSPTTVGAVISPTPGSGQIRSN